MARKNNDAAFDAFLADLKAINPQIEELVKDDNVKSKLRESVLARSDYNASMDALRKEREEMQAFLTTERQKIDGWTKWYGDASREVATIQQELETYREEFGELDSKTQKQVARSQGLSVEEFEKKLNEEISKRDVAALQFVDVLTDIKLNHRQKFNEKLDTAAVYKIAGEKNLPLDVAYDVFIADRVEDLRTKDVADQIAKAREEGAREALAKHNLPVISNDSSVVHVLDAKNVQSDPSARVSAAVQSFLNRK